MGRRTVSMAAAAALLAGGLLALPGEATAGINHREHNQRQRIAAGVADGSLTAREAHRLTHQQARIERYERRSRRDDGRLDRRERARIHHGLSHSSYSVFRARHNERSRD